MNPWGRSTEALREDSAGQVGGTSHPVVDSAGGEEHWRGTDRHHRRVPSTVHATGAEPESLSEWSWDDHPPGAVDGRSHAMNIPFVLRVRTIEEESPEVVGPPPDPLDSFDSFDR
jgi:hypothetical protein